MYLQLLYIKVLFNLFVLAPGRWHALLFLNEYSGWEEAVQLVIGVCDNIIKELCCDGFPALVHAR